MAESVVGYQNRRMKCRFDPAVVQAEDELAAAGMVLGAVTRKGMTCTRAGNLTNVWL